MGGSDPAPVGGILAGGASRRFGSDKAGALLDGRPLAGWGALALGEVVDEVVLLGGDRRIASRLGLPLLPDRGPAGPLAGVAAGLRHAREEGRPGLLVVACDLPFVPPALLAALLGARTRDIDVVVPEIPDPPGIQPLCAWYAPETEDGVDGYLRRGRRSVLGLLDELKVRRLPLHVVAGITDPDRAFRNVNTPEALERARADLDAG